MCWINKQTVWGFSICLILLATVESKAQQRELPDYRLDLGEVVVTASRIEQIYKYSSQNISIIKEEDIKASGIHDVAEMLDVVRMTQAIRKAR